MSRTFRAHEGERITLGLGVRVKELNCNRALGRWMIPVDVEPGATFPSHEHVQDEEIYMISDDGIVTLAKCSRFRGRFGSMGAGVSPCFRHRGLTASRRY
jgi:hypothetical protein